MPVEVKPLFRPDVVRPRLTAFLLTDECEQNALTVLTKWRELLTGQGSDKLKEQEILPDFLIDVFGSVLGYQRPVDAPPKNTHFRSSSSMLR